LDPEDAGTRQRFRYPDAPRVDLRDPALKVIMENQGKLDTASVKRLATVYMASHAVEMMDTGRAKLSDFTKLMLAALGEY
jgi:hypothetical protein